ncbi:MAG: hypothetical protein AB1749_01880 [Pseudomonadota bacterium]
MRQAIASIVAALVCLLAASPPATADVPGLPGWTANPSPNGLLLASPSDSLGGVMYLLPVVAPLQRRPGQWLASLVDQAIGKEATVSSRSGVLREGSLFKEAVLLRDKDGAEIYLTVVAYKTAHGHQALVLLYPTTIADDDPRVEQALEHMATLWKSGFHLAASGGAAPSDTPPSSPPVASSGGSGKPPRQRNCRREPVWGQRISAFCKPTGICPDRVIKEYRTVCD